MNPAATTDAVPDVGARLGDHELLHRIGSDDLTTAFYARTKQGTSLPRIVVLEVCHAALARDEAFASRFLAQMRAAAKVRHLNLVTPTDVRNEGASFVVADFIDAASVSELTTAALVSGESIAADVSLRVVVDLLSGLQALHSWRDTDGSVPALVHGDVSPRDVLVGAEGTTKLTGQGWSGLRALAPGVARVADWSRGYHAPELAEGGPATVAGDVFSAAVLLWELLSGRRLYADGAIAPTGADVIAPSTLVTGLPVKVDAAIQKALDADPAKRFASAMDFSRALETSGAKIALRSSVGVFVSRLAKEPLSKRREVVRQLRAAASRAVAPPSAASTAASAQPSVPMPVAGSTPTTAATVVPAQPVAPSPVTPPAAAVVASAVPMPQPTVAMPSSAARAAVPSPKPAEPKVTSARVLEPEPPPAASTPSHGTPVAVVAPTPPAQVTPAVVPLPGRPQRGRTLIGAAPPAPPTSGIVAPLAPPPPTPAADESGELNVDDIVSMSRPPEAASVVHHAPPPFVASTKPSFDTTAQLDVDDLVERVSLPDVPVVAPAVPPTSAAKPSEPVVPMVAPAVDPGFEFDIADDALDASAAVVAPAPALPPPRADAFARLPEVSATPSAPPRYRSIEPTALEDEPELPVRRSSAPVWLGIVSVVVLAGLGGAYVLHARSSDDSTRATPQASPTDAGHATAAPTVQAVATTPSNIPAVAEAGVATASPPDDSAVTPAETTDAAAVAVASVDAQVAAEDAQAAPPTNETVAVTAQTATDAGAEQATADNTSAADAAPSTHHHHHHHGTNAAQHDETTPANASSHASSHSDANGSHHTHHGEYRPGGL